MQFFEITIATSATFTNNTAAFILLISWNNPFSITDPQGSAASGSITAYVATNSIVLIPPGWHIVNTAGAFQAQALALTASELQSAVVGAITPIAGQLQ